MDQQFKRILRVFEKGRWYKSSTPWVGIEKLVLRSIDFIIHFTPPPSGHFREFWREKSSEPLLLPTHKETSHMINL
jgi:hypothetical protein